MNAFARWLLLISTLLGMLMTPGAALAQDDAVMRAMRDELARSMKQLQLEDLEKPYFIAYRVQEKTEASAAASFGALLSSNMAHVRYLTVEIRVGSPKLDNTNFLSMASLMGGGLARGVGGAVQLPLDNNYKELRRQIWLATDGAYKQVLEDIARKRAAMQNKTSTEELPDFSDEKTATTSGTQSRMRTDVTPLETMARVLSGIFNDKPSIYTDSARVNLSQAFTRYVNSEGTTYTRNSSDAEVIVVAETQAPDGMALKDFVAAYGHQWEDLPSQKDLEAKVRAMGEHLENIRSSSLVERYNGPVLFEGEAAAELFGQVVAPNLLASRRPISDNPQFEMFASRIENPFQDKLGGRVLPDFMTLVDDPTVSNYQGKTLLGSALVDDDGVPTRRTSLVENGVLKTLLTTRNPVGGMPQSTGSRRGVAAAPSNLLVTVDKGLTEQALQEKLLSIVKQRGKPFGIVVERLASPYVGDQRELMQSMMGSLMQGEGGEGAGAKQALVAYELFPDGHKERVRNVSIDGINAASFKDMVAASETSTVYSTPFISLGGSLFSIFSSGGAAADTSAPLISMVVPSMLFDDATLKHPVGQIPRPPISSRPVGVQH